MYFYVSIGSNIEPEKNAVAILSALCSAFGATQVFPFIKTAPVNINSSHYFLNSLAVFQTDLPQQAVKQITNQIEITLGRDRQDSLSSFKDRQADIDILHVAQSLDLDYFTNKIESYLGDVLKSTDSLIVDLSSFGLAEFKRPTTVNLDSRTGHIMIVDDKFNGL